MPLPLIPLIAGAAALGSAAYGIKKGVDAYKDTEKAGEYKRWASEDFEESQEDLQRRRGNAEEKLESLGRRQKDIIERDFKRYSDLIERLGVDSEIELSKIFGDQLVVLEKTQKSIVSLGNALTGIVSSAAAGTMAGFGAFGAAGLFASASTGTAISALSGVAATNATLAFFGGGSLAAGGLGMVGGMWALGGIVASPVVLVASTIFASKAEENKLDAESYYNSVKALCKAMDGETLIWQELENKVREKIKTLKDLEYSFETSMDDVTWILEKQGECVGKWNNEDQNKLKEMIQLAESLVNVIEAPLMNDADPTTQSLMNHQKKCQELAKEINRKWGK